jgi:hypothetical protein
VYPATSEIEPAEISSPLMVSSVLAVMVEVTPKVPAIAVLPVAWSTVKTVELMAKVVPSSVKRESPTEEALVNLVIVLAVPEPVMPPPDPAQFPKATKQKVSLALS